MIQGCERPARGWLVLLALAAVGLPLMGAACGGDDDDDDDTGATPTAASATTTAAGGEILDLGGTRFANEGTEDVRGVTEVDVIAANFSFSPTFLRGEPGQRMTVSLENTSSAIHNFTIEGQEIDEDIPAGATATVEVSFPESGVLLFACKYHAGSGMNGELLAGDAEPQAPPMAGEMASPTATADGSGGPYDY